MPTYIDLYQHGPWVGTGTLQDDGTITEFEEQPQSTKRSEKLWAAWDQIERAVAAGLKEIEINGVLFSWVVTESTDN